METWTGTLTQNEEDVANIKALNERRVEIGLPPLPVPALMGQALINGQLSPHTQAGEVEVLNYQLLSVTTGLPVPDPLGIASVLYEAHLDFNSPLVFTPLGFSNAASNNFALSWTVSGFEPTIRATRFDASGLPLQVISTVTNDNTLIGTGFQTTAVPEPPVLALSNTAVLGLLVASAWRRKRRRS